MSHLHVNASKECIRNVIALQSQLYSRKRRTFFFLCCWVGNCTRCLSSPLSESKPNWISSPENRKGKCTTEYDCTRDDGKKQEIYYYIWFLIDQYCGSNLMAMMYCLNDANPEKLIFIFPNFYFFKILYLWIIELELMKMNEYQQCALYFNIQWHF